MTTQKPMAHLVGSVPLSDTESVFRTVAGHLGRRAFLIGCAIRPSSL